MGICTYSVSPVTSLDNLKDFFSKETTELFPDIELYVQQLLVQETVVSFLKAPPGLFAKLNTITDSRNKKRDITIIDAVEAFKKQRYAFASLPYFLGVMLFSKDILRRLFCDGIQTIELVDPTLSLVYRNRSRSLCIRYIDQQPRISFSEYTQEGVLNASRRISPRTVLFMCIQEPLESNVSVVESFVCSKETDLERHIRLTTTMIGH